MDKIEIEKIIACQRKYFATGATLPVNKRLDALRRLQAAMKKYSDRLDEALRADLGKSEFESFMCECGLSENELVYMIRHTRGFARDRHVSTPLTNFPAKSFMRPSPYGTVLIMSTWNYPVLLTLDPLIDALAAGNTAVVKPSAYSPATSAVLGEMLSDAFKPEEVAVITGGRAENSALLECDLDYIFFTGSLVVGHEVMRRAAENLTPVTLELGGKSPCIVDETADVKLAARRIVFGKYLNCGQTCVAPDHVYCHKTVLESFISAVKEEIVRQYGSTPLSNELYGKMVNKKHFDRVCSLIDEDKVVFGGASDASSFKIEPTVMAGVTQDDRVMQEEIFGPLMPIISFDDTDEVISEINKRPHPLALYIFARDKSVQQKFLSLVSFGGGCINDTIMHLSVSNMGFGGVGGSGMGAYHGRIGFDTFSHVKSIVDRKAFPDVPIRYQPYSAMKEKGLRFFFEK